MTRVNMKLCNVPPSAFEALPMPIPPKRERDWESCMLLIQQQGFIVFSVTEKDLRVSKLGAEECLPVKAFYAYMYRKYRQPIKNKRIDKNRWFVTI